MKKTKEIVERAVQLQAELSRAQAAEADAVLRQVEATVELERMRPALREALAPHEGKVVKVWADGDGRRSGGFWLYAVRRGELAHYEAPAPLYLDELDGEDAPRRLTDLAADVLQAPYPLTATADPARCA
jgi:hypothetical protein